MLYSRQQYLNNVISHEDYYAQFIEAGKSLGFDFVDDVKLYYYDQISASGGGHVRNQATELGSFCSMLSTRNCSTRH